MKGTAAQAIAFISWNLRSDVRILPAVHWPLPWVVSALTGFWVPQSESVGVQSCPEGVKWREH